MLRNETRVWERWDPQEYLKDYYDSVDNENRALLKFYAQESKDVPEGSTVLDFGCGPTIYALISIASKAKHICVCDPLDSNLDEIRTWLSGGGFDWMPYFRYALRAEGLTGSRQECNQRAELLRRRLLSVGRCDALGANPLDDSARGPWDVVVSNFCAECITSDREAWRQAVRTILGLVASGGKVLLCSIEGATSYSVGVRRFGAVPVTADDVRQVMGISGFDKIVTSTVEACGEKGYTGIIMASGRRREGPTDGQ